MNPRLRQFYFKTSIFTFIICAISFILFSTVLKPWYINTYPLLVLYIASLSAIGNWWVLRASEFNPRRFTTAFMTSVTVKLMGYLIFILIYLLVDRSQAVHFLITFFTLYILFTVFEVSLVLKFLKK